jgi:hypothetical protein
MQFAVHITFLQACTICYTGHYGLYSKCKTFWEMPSKRNRVIECDSEKKRQEQANS